MNKAIVRANQKEEIFGHTIGLFSAAIDIGEAGGWLPLLGDAVVKADAGFNVGQLHSCHL